MYLHSGEKYNIPRSRKIGDFFKNPKKLSSLWATCSQTQPVPSPLGWGWWGARGKKGGQFSRYWFASLPSHILYIHGNISPSMFTFHIVLPVSFVLGWSTMLKKRKKLKPFSFSEAGGWYFSWGQRLVAQESDFPSMFFEKVEVFVFNTQTPFPLECF